MRGRTAKKVEAVVGEDREAVIQAIRDARTRAGLTQEEAAGLVKGRATSTISHWETGGLPRRWDLLIEYAHLLEQEIVLRFGPKTEEAPRPGWVRGLEDRLLRAIEDATAGQADAMAATLLAALRAELPQGNDEGAPEDEDS